MTRPADQDCQKFPGTDLLISEAAKILGVDRRTAYRWAKAGHGPAKAWAAEYRARQIAQAEAEIAIVRLRKAERELIIAQRGIA